jgi:polysaccharide pyruvyl transferase WcaK-like protein
MIGGGGNLLIGLWGLLGSGNIGNDASTDALMTYLSKECPDAVVDAMCMGWEQLSHRYGIATTPFQWQQMHQRPGALGMGPKVLGKFIDIFRTLSWVRKHDAVIIPGMGIMDAALPINPWGVPYALFLLTLCARLTRTKVILVSAGATPARRRLTRWLFTKAAGMATYRSFRDLESREVLRRQGLNTSADKIYPDLVFSLPVEQLPMDPDTVGVGVMAYYGSNEDRHRAGEIYAAYTGAIREFVYWLLDNGRNVRLFVGDELDQVVVDQLIAEVRRDRPEVSPARVTGEPVKSAAELLRLMQPVATVVATRFHNVVYAVKLAKPTVSIGYSPKNDSLMRDIGLADYCQHARSIDVELLKTQFTNAEKRREEITSELGAHVKERLRATQEQFAELTMLLTAGRLTKPPAAISESEATAL